MTLTKANIVEEVAKQNGYPKNHSSEMIEILLENHEREPWNPVRTSWSVARQSSVSKTKHERRGRNQQPVRT